MPDVDAFEVFLRVFSAVTITLAAWFVADLLWHRRILRPRPVWVHVFFVLLLVGFWRWVVVALVRFDLWPDWGTHIIAWVQPVNQSLYALIGVSFAILALVSSRRRVDDE